MSGKACIDACSSTLIVLQTFYLTFCKGAYLVTQSKRQQERQWKDRKQSQNPHGKVHSFEQLAEDTGKNESETK